jgi:hypothetical protein
MLFFVIAGPPQGGETRQSIANFNFLMDARASKYTQPV